MGTKMIIGLVLIVLGILGLAYGGIQFTTKEKVVDAGPIQISADKTHSLPIAPIVGGLLLAGGIVLVVTGRKGGAA